MRITIVARTTLVAATLLGCSGAPTHSEHDHGPHGRHALGEVDFATTCSAPAHRHFNQGMLYQHSFWYRASRQSFEETLRADPRCVIAYWGIGQSLLLNPFGPPPAKSLAEGLAALEKAESLGAGSQREKDFIAALKTFYAEHDKRDHRSRVQAYLKSMEALAARYPGDDEAQIYYALALNVAASPSDKTYALPLRAAAILEPIMLRRPQHPGVAHYLVHSYDFPAIADKGVAAAKRYAEIAGDSPHALHMPSHIFTRVGYWAESIAANEKSARVARQDKEPDDELHAMDYLVYAHLQLGQDDTAGAVLERMKSVSGVNASRHTGPFALASASARLMVERGDWKGAAALPVQPTSFSHVAAISHFARALGAARSGDVASARADAARLAELRDKLHAARDAYWTEQVAIQRDVADAWILHAAGQHEDGLRRMQAAADAEDRTDKHVVTPGPLAPARELYGAMLLQRGRAAEALSAFEATLRKEPRRLNATLGAGRAAELAGDRARARQHYAAALALSVDGRPVRADLSHAKAYVASNK